MTEQCNRPNLLLITADQWRGDFIGPGSRAAGLTPNLDALAREGTRFSRHYCQAYPCGPSRASLYTGLYPHKHRSVTNGMPLDARHPTVFQCLRGAGYRPSLFGYTDVTLDPRGRAPADPDNGDYENVCPGLAPVFLMTERATPWLARLRARGVPVRDPDAGRYGIFAETAFGEPTLFAADDSEAAVLTDAFVDWLGVAGSAPFSAHLSFIAPHPPFAAPAGYHDLVDPGSTAAPVRGADAGVEAAQSPLIEELLRTTPLGGFLSGVRGRTCEADDAMIARTRAVYAGMIAELDRQIGRVFAALRASGHWDDTVIVFTADHGEQLFDHYLLGKTGYFDQSAHVPLIIRDPRPEAAGGRGRTVAALTESIDVMPTVLDVVGQPLPRNCDGRSLVPFLSGSTPEGWRDEVHWSFDFRDIVTRQAERAFGIPSAWCNLQVVRTERLKYVHFAGLPPVLFDLAEDPHELVNRVGDPSAQALRIEGLERLLSWRQRTEEHTLTGYLAQDGAQHLDDGAW